MALENAAVTSSQNASRVAKEVRTKNEELSFDVEKLFLISQALWEILKHNHGYTDDQLEDMITDIDLRDGRLDGKIAKAPDLQKCEQCGRTLMRKKLQCMYCGESNPQQPFRR